MTIALDASVLIYGSHERAPDQERAAEVLRAVVDRPELVYVFWPVALAYLRVVTDPRIFALPLARTEAEANLDALLSRPNVRSPGEAEGFWPIYRSVAAEADPRGRLVPDAHIVALMRQHGVRTILTRDRGFRRFDGIRVVDPFAV